MVEEAKQKTNEKSDAVRGDIISVLQNLRNGDCVFELSQELEEVVAAVGETGKKGSITLKLSIDPHKGDTLTLDIEDKIEKKVPKKDKPPSIFFRGKNNQLQRQDPRQLNLPL